VITSWLDKCKNVGNIYFPSSIFNNNDIIMDKDIRSSVPARYSVCVRHCKYENVPANKKRALVAEEICQRLLTNSRPGKIEKKNKAILLSKTYLM
jgi:hypothetical protein